MDNDQEGENKLRFPKKVFSFIEIDGMGKARVWMGALIAWSIQGNVPQLAHEVNTLLSHFLSHKWFTYFYVVISMLIN